MVSCVAVLTSHRPFAPAAMSVPPQPVCRGVTSFDIGFVVVAEVPTPARRRVVAVKSNSTALARARPGIMRYVPTAMATGAEVDSRCAHLFVRFVVATVFYARLPFI